MQQPAQIQNTPFTVFVNKCFWILPHIYPLLYWLLNKSANFIQPSPMKIETLISKGMLIRDQTVQANTTPYKTVRKQFRTRKMDITTCVIKFELRKHYLCCPIFFQEERKVSYGT